MTGLHSIAGHPDSLSQSFSPIRASFLLEQVMHTSLSRRADGCDLTRQSISILTIENTEGEIRARSISLQLDSGQNGQYSSQQRQEFRRERAKRRYSANDVRQRPACGTETRHTTRHRTSSPKINPPPDNEGNVEIPLWSFLRTPIQTHCTDNASR